MKKVLFLLLSAVFLHVQLPAQSKTISFQFEPGSTSGIVNQKKIESNVSVLLSTINKACIADDSLSLAGILIEKGASDNLKLLWENVHFYCEDNQIISKCLHDMQGLQIRDISITLKPKVKYDESLERELTISLSRSGMITGVRMALSNNQYKKVMDDGSIVTDVRERMEILKFVEDFRCYYNERNLEALKKVYADDALIITGSVISFKPSSVEVPQSRIRYRKQNKTEYINNLARMFKTKKYIDIGFDRISIVRHGTKPQYYGVTLHQDWKTDNYKDQGWLFLLWDFTNPDEPVIHVRTWQPDDAVKEEGGIFELNDFFL